MLKARSLRRKPTKERWNIEELRDTQGLPWEPIPGLGEREAKSTVYVKIPEEPNHEAPSAKRKVPAARRARTTR